jgi:filamentous hemagglutinin family protein
MKKSWTFFFWIIASSILVTFTPALKTTAQEVVPDETLPNDSTVTTQENQITIDGGTTEGDNLYHSFSEFSVPTGAEVDFNNADNIENIFSRVTGSDVSNIDGLIKANGTANLFLLNPNGVIFGNGASLDLGGSFVASTAENIKFEDGSQFSATNPTESILTVSVPVGLGMGDSSKSILVLGDGTGVSTTPQENTSGLRVQPNQTLALVGNDVKLEGGTLTTPGGRIELGSVAAPGLVKIESIDKGIALGYQNIPTFGNIQLSNSSKVDASGDGGGDIQARGRQIKLEGASRIEADTLGAGGGGTLNISADEELELVGIPGVKSAENTVLTTKAEEEATSNGGNLKIETGRLTIRDDAGISATTDGAGNAGSIEVFAHDSIELARRSTFRPGSFISVIAEPNSTGAGGNLTIETKRLTLRDGAVLAAGTFGEGAGGNLSVKATDSIELVGESLKGESPSRISARTEGTGKGGDLSIETGKFSIRDGARVTVNSQEPGIGDAGTLKINADSLKLDRGGSITAETVSGNGGNITLDADQLQLRNNSNITATADNNGDGGNINIKTDTLTAIENSDIIADAEKGMGGSINISATKGVFRSPDSEIRASSELGIDGTVKIDAQQNFESLLKFDTPETIDTKALIANSCLDRNRKKLEFANKRGGYMPVNPDSGVDINEIEPIPTVQENTEIYATTNSTGETLIYPSDNESSWQPGDSVIEANAIVQTPDGRILGVRKMQPIEAKALICQEN